MDDKFAGKFRAFLFQNKFKKTDKHPAYVGRAVFTKDQINRLLARSAAARGEEEIQCELAGWKYISDTTGDPYVFVSVDCDTAPKSGKKTDESAETQDDIPF